MVAGYFIIAILGCADDSSHCTPVMTVPTHYATEAECEAATPDVLLANTSFDFPSLLAECRAGAPREAAGQEVESHGATRRG